MDLQIDSTGPFTLAKVSGELTGQDVEQFTEELYGFVAGQAATLALDLSALDLIDSKGLAALIDLSTRARLSYGKMVLVQPPAFVMGIFDVTRLSTWLDICGSVEEVAERLS